MSSVPQSLRHILGVAEPQFILVFLHWGNTFYYDHGAEVGATLCRDINFAVRYSLPDAEGRLAYLKKNKRNPYAYDRGEIQLAPSTQHE